MPDKRVELSLSSLVYGGDAMGRDAEGRTIFVPFGLPGELVRVEITESHRSWARGRLLEILEPSPERVAPRCRHFGACGGCHYQHMPYPVQLLHKARIVREQLTRIGGFRDPPVEPAIPSLSPWNTRNHLQFSLTPQGELGFRATDPRKVLAIQECHLPEPSLADLWPRIRLQGHPSLRRVALRAGVEGQRMIHLIGEGKPEVEVQIDVPGSVVWSSHQGTVVLAGEPHLWMRVAGQRFRVSARSFFQVHTALAPTLVQEAMEALALRPGHTVLDLYAGVGLFSLFTARTGGHVIAVEADPEACADFQHNLEAFAEVRLVRGRVEQVLRRLKGPTDAVLADPPRRGLGSKVVEGIAALRPSRVVYVSCDPATMARDARILAAKGYRLARVAPIDLFPQTFHIETVSLFVR